MVRTLLAIFRSAWLVELAGGGLIVAGVVLQWGATVGLMTGGGMLVLKAFELDGRT